MSLNFRLFHISDLHFGNTLYPLMQRISNWLPFSTHLETHDMMAVRQLAVSLGLQHQSLRAGTWGIVATGDLTTFGSSGAFNIAYEYLRELPSNRNYYTLGDVNAPVVPGNHDIWGGVIWGISKNAQDVRDKHFNKPAPSEPSFNSFPYRIIIQNGPPPIYVYGLDTTQVDKKSSQFLVSWDNFKAIGFLDGEQLDKLQSLIANEPSSGIRPIRIAALHHPLAYPTTNGTPKRLRALVNLDEVLLKLQGLGFAIVLCGHQHKGFVRQMSAKNSSFTPIYVFSVGTATQATLPNSAYPNEYRIYDFKADQHDQCSVMVRCFKFKDVYGVQQFEPDAGEQVQINLRLNDYRI